MKTQNFTKLGENMWQMTLNKHAKFHGNQTIGGAITVEKASKTKDLYGKWPQIGWKCSYIHTNTRSSYHMIDVLILNNFASGTNVVNKAVN